MVPIAKAAVLLVLLGGATVSTYAVANGGFGNKAKSSEESKEATGTDVSGDAKSATTDQSGEAKDSPKSMPAAQGGGAQVGGESAAGKGEVDSTSPEGSSRPEAGGTQESAGTGDTPESTGSQNAASTPAVSATSR